MVKSRQNKYRRNRRNKTRRNYKGGAGDLGQELELEVFRNATININLDMYNTECTKVINNILSEIQNSVKQIFPDIILKITKDSLDDFKSRLNNYYIDLCKKQKIEWTDAGMGARNAHLKEIFSGNCWSLNKMPIVIHTNYNFVIKIISYTQQLNANNTTLPICLFNIYFSDGTKASGMISNTGHKLDEYMLYLTNDVQSRNLNNFILQQLRPELREKGHKYLEPDLLFDYLMTCPDVKRLEMLNKVNSYLNGEKATSTTNKAELEERKEQLVNKMGNDLEQILTNQSYITNQHMSGLVSDLLDSLKITITGNVDETKI